MKKLTLIVTVAASLLLSACDKITGSDINTAETMGEIKKLVKENVTDKDMRLISLTVMPKEALDNKPDVVALLAADADNNFHELNFILELGKYDMTKDEKVADTEDGNKYNGHKNAADVPTLDMDKMPDDVIVKQVEEATHNIPAEFEFRGVGSYNVSTLSGKPKTEFKIQITEKGKSTKLENRRIETTYYELKCSVDDNGKVTVEED